MLFLRKSRPRFQGYKHINLYKLCYNISINADGTIVGGGVYPAFYTLAQLQAIRTLGFDSVRLCFRGDPLVAAKYAGDTTTFATLLAQIISAGALCLQAGLLVNFDFHPSGIFAPKIVASSDPTSAYFVAYVQAASGLASAIAAAFLPENVAMDLLNEPNPSTNYWASTLQPVAFAAVRSAAPQLTLIVRGEGDAMANLSNMRVADYDWNTLYSVHNYDFVDFTYSSSAEQGEPIKYYGAVDYPPDGLSAAAAIARTSANINADAALTSAQKAAYIADASTRLTNYYANFTRVGLLQNDLPLITAWALKNGIDSTQIYIGEMGVMQSGSANSATVAARGAWYADTTGWYSAKGIRWGVFCADIASFIDPMTTAAFHICDPSAGAGAVADSTNVPTAIKSALGLV